MGEGEGAGGADEMLCRVRGVGGEFAVSDGLVGGASLEGAPVEDGDEGGEGVAGDERAAGAEVVELGDGTGRHFEARLGARRRGFGGEGFRKLIDIKGALCFLFSRR